MRLAITYDDYVCQENKDSNCEAYGGMLHECVTRLVELIGSTRKDEVGYHA